MRLNVRLTALSSLKTMLMFALINSAVFIAFRPDGIARLVIAIMLNVSGVLLIAFFLKLRKHAIGVGVYFTLLFVVLGFWSLFTVFRSFRLEADQVLTLFGHFLMGWAWVTPLAAVYGMNPRYWLEILPLLRKILFAIIPLTPLAFALGPYFAYGLLEIAVLFAPVCLAARGQTLCARILTISFVANFACLSLIAHQRANIVFLLIVLAFMFIEFSRRRDLRRMKKFFTIGAISIVLVASALIVNQYLSELLSNRDIVLDTRTFLVTELLADMSEDELIYGRGALGTYYSPYFAYTESHGLPGDSPIRSVNEIGYLHMILKGGFVIVMLYLLVFVPASFLGITRSRNSICRMSGYLIAAYILLWLVSYYPVFGAEYLLLWMAVGTCISPKLRAMSDREIVTMWSRGRSRA